MNTHEEALENLQFIRHTIERSTKLTGVSGIGLIAMGIMGAAAAYVAAFRHSVDWWVNAWTYVAIVAFATGVCSMWYKGERTGNPIFTGAGRRFILALAPPIVAGIVLTNLFYMNSQIELVPGTWLLLYGVGVVTAGAFSIRLIPFMGIVFMVLGSVALYLPNSSFAPVFGNMTGQDLLLAAGFGGIHIIFGAIIGVRHGG
jgi:hypothetical protein